MRRVGKGRVSACMHQRRGLNPSPSTPPLPCTSVPTPLSLPPRYTPLIGLLRCSPCDSRVLRPVSQLYNNLALGHVLISDDGGDSWRLGSADGFGGGVGGAGANEAQLAQLANGSILVNSRSLSTGSRQRRVQARSDDGGETFTRTTYVEELPEPFNGCQGSLVAGNGTLFFSHPLPAPSSGLVPEALRKLSADVNLTGRDHMTVWSSVDGGATFDVAAAVDEGAAGYSSLQAGGEGELWILYEQSDPAAETPAERTVEALLGELAVLNPDRLVLRQLRGLQRARARESET